MLKKIALRKTIKIFLIIGASIFTIKYGEIALRSLNKGYGATIQVETWNKRLAKYEEGEINKKQLKENSLKCIFARIKGLLPQIRESIGDTININKTNAWISNLGVTDGDKEVRKVLNKGEKFFQINETEKYITIGFLEDEGEYLGIYAYSINKENCEIIGEVLLAEATGWENGYKETYSIIKDNFSIRREKKVGTKDWGDHTKWAKDTIISMITFDIEGKMKLE
ncbi:MAG: hypothetical protein DHS20C18_53250 [Saprospiraceae bacterium]|nr:MAG: hypothetical protein DHS20C18_53250 [Saprospiraceae bacterium]